MPPRTPIYVDSVHNEPIFREETEGKRRLLRGLGGPPSSFSAAGSRFEAGPEFEALKENLADIGEEGTFGHTTPLYHPYAEPLSHYNPLDEAHDESDIEVFRDPIGPLRDSARARRPTSPPPPPMPEPLPLKQEQVPFREPPRLKAPRRLHLPNMNVGQILDGHREHSQPVYESPDFSGIHGTAGISNFREEIKPLGHRPLSSIPTPPMSKPPKLFDFDPPIDFPEPEAFGPFTERPVPFPVRNRPLAPSSSTFSDIPKRPLAPSSRFSDIPKFDLSRDFDFDEEVFNGGGPKPFSMAEIRSTPLPPPSLPSPARPSFRQRSRSLDHTVPLKFGPANSEFFKEHGPHDDGGFGHIPSEFLPGEARGAGGFMGPLLNSEDDDLDMSSLGAMPRPPIDQPPPPPGTQFNSFL